LQLCPIIQALREYDTANRYSVYLALLQLCCSSVAALLQLCCSSVASLLLREYDSLTGAHFTGFTGAVYLFSFLVLLAQKYKYWPDTANSECQKSAANQYLKRLPLIP
jgi:hypothetical protein